MNPDASNVASHRLGWSETSTRELAGDPRGWALAQLQSPQAPSSDGLTTTADLVRQTRELLRRATQAKPAPSEPGMAPMQAGAPPAPRADAVQAERQALRQQVLQALTVRWSNIIATRTPVAERWVQFWANHLCVSGTRVIVAPLVWNYEAQAIRPNAFASFAHLLKASVLHPAMLLYLDNAQSIGPDSPVGKRRDKGLNENLARELLELHTLGVNAGYTQDDVTQVARILTDWTLDRDDPGQARFEPGLHQPGSKTVLGRSYAEGPQALDELLRDLARHPATAQHLATQLARHFVTDDPPAELVQAVAQRYTQTEGDLAQTAQALMAHPLTWDSRWPPKFKRPEEWVLSAHRVLKLPLLPAQAPALYGALTALGQTPGRAPSPQGWPDRSEDWLSPEALLQRSRFAQRFGRLQSDQADARAVAELIWAGGAPAALRQELAGAPSNAQALALVLSSPEFMQR